jgi:predicted nucleic acid-binding protein
MPTDLFVDTSGWLELVDHRQPFHELANRRVNEALRDGSLLITSNLVLIELVALMTSPIRITKPRQIAILHDLQQDPTIEVVFVDQQATLHAWHLWENRQDKLWSLVDCTSFILMQDRGIDSALTMDHHFEQAGFARLLH